MKKNLIKIISVLTAIMVLSGVLTVVNFSANAIEDVLFEDNFDSYVELATNALRKTAFEKKGWGANSGFNNTKAGYASTGEYKIPESVEVFLANTGVSGADTWSDYAVEADMRFNSALETPATNNYSMLVVNAPTVMTGGYEFGFGYLTDGSKQIVLRRRSNPDEYTGETFESKNFDFDTSGATVYKLKIEYTGGVLKGYVDGTLTLTRDVSSSDVKINSGYGGFRKNGKDCEVVFDNFRLYKQTDGLFDMPFTGSYTGAALTAMGYGASGVGIDTMASYIVNDKLSFPKDIPSVSLFYSPQINIENYKIGLDFTVDEKYGSGTPTYGLVFGAPGTELKNCYNFVLQVNGANGYVQGSKVRWYNASGGGSDYFVPSTQISTADRQDKTCLGAKISIEAVVSYDSGSEKTTVNFTVTGNEKTVQTYSITHTGMLKGHAAIFSSKQGGVSFDNFRCIPEQAETQGDTYFFDDFEDEKTMTENGWSHNSGTKSGGVLTLTDGKFAYTTGAAGASTWTDYAVTAKLKTGITAIPSDESKSITSIVARSNNAANGGYEFGILVDKTGAYYQLYKRANPTVGGKINGELNKISKNIDLTATHNMKIIVKGARILCYDGDELIFDVTDTYDDGNEYSAGYAGVRAPAGTGIYDDFTCRAITEEEETAIAAIAPVVPPDDSEENDENILFKDDFDSSKAMSESGWNANSTTGEKSGGVFTLSYNRATYVTKIDGSDKWDDYVVEADIRYNSADIEEGVSTAINILTRSTKTTSNGYEFGFRCDGSGNTYVRLYKRGVSGGKIGGVEYSIPYTVLPDTFYHAKIVAVGNRIIGYFNNMKVFDVVDEKEPFSTGYPGMRNAGSNEKVGYTSSYDNFVVRKVLTSDIIDDEKIKRLNGKIWFFDDFDAETSLTERGWNSDTPQFSSGSVSMVETSNSIYLTGVEGSEKWRDYTVKADVVIDKSKGTLGGQTMGATWISARSTRTTSSGYEFGIMSYASGKTNLRLREVAGKKDLMLLDGYEVTDGVHQLKMTCQSNVIRCYFDGKLVITASDTVNKMGYPGIRASGYIANYDNFTVSDIEADEVLDLPKTDENTVKSPLTGNLHFVFAAAPFVFAVSFSALAFVLIRFIINRRKIFK